jgi:hypothetical protein
MVGWITIPVLLLPACTPLPGGATGSAASPAGDLPPEDQLLVPPGYGSLRQEEITLSLRDGAVQVQMTPLEEWVIRLAAPDTYRRLSALRASRQPSPASSSSASPGKLFLVSFYSEEEGQEFHPEDLHLESLGRRQLATAIQPMTPGWGTQRLGQRQAESAVYAFRDDVTLDAGLVAEYRGVRNHDWTMILADLLAEQARVGGRTDAR